MWQELQAVRTEISSLEEQKEHISSMVKALVVSAHLSLIEYSFLSFPTINE